MLSPWLLVALAAASLEGEPLQMLEIEVNGDLVNLEFYIHSNLTERALKAVATLGLDNDPRPGATWHAAMAACNVERIVAEHQRVHRADRVRRDIPERRRHRAEEHEERQKAHHARTHRATPRHGQSRRARCRMRAPRACRGCSTDDEVLRFLKLSSSPGCRRAVLGS